jgi:hypothetical protein
MAAGAWWARPWGAGALSAGMCVTVIAVGPGDILSKADEAQLHNERMTRQEKVIR